MAKTKICRSCGNYYSGDHCTKCGYGKPDVKSKKLEKYKKVTKPERFMTDEEKKEFYDRQREKNKQAQERTADPNARRNLLIVTAVVVIGMVFAVLISNGLLFHSEKTDIIEQYCRALTNRSYDEFIKCFPKEVKNAYEDERKSLGYDKSQAMESFLADLDAYYGSGLSVNVTFGKEEQVDISELSIDDYKAQYGTAPAVSEVYIIVCEVTYSGSLTTETIPYEFYVGKVSGKWKIFNIQMLIGIINESMEIVEPEGE